MRKASSPQSTTTGHRLTVATALLAVLLTVVTAGCGRITNEPSAAGANSSTQPSRAAAELADADAASPAPDPAEPVGGGGQPGSGGNQTGYPANAQAYAEAVIAAWAGADLSRLAELTTPLVHEQLIQIPGAPASDWTRIQCDGGDCMYYNGHGDFLLLHIQLSQFSKPHAANHVTFDAITYPADHLDYLKAFVKAWQQGNLARMNALALPEVVAVFQARSAGQVTNYGQAGGGGGLSIVIVTTVGTEIETHIATTMLGGPQAIRQAIPAA